MSVEKLYDLIEEFFGYKVKMRYLNSETKEVACILYDSFWVKCSLDDRYGRFGAGIVVGNGEGVLTEFLNRRCSSNSDENVYQRKFEYY